MDYKQPRKSRRREISNSKTDWKPKASEKCGSKVSGCGKKGQKWCEWHQRDDQWREISGGVGISSPFHWPSQSVGLSHRYPEVRPSRRPATTHQIESGLRCFDSTRSPLPCERTRHFLSNHTEREGNRITSFLFGKTFCQTSSTPHLDN